MSLTEQFLSAVKGVRELEKGQSNDELLTLYGLYKQATEGDNEKSKPMFIDIKGKAKWDTWNKNKGMPKEEAMQKYIDYVDELGQKYDKAHPDATAEVNKVVHDAIDNAFKGF